MTAGAHCSRGGDCEIVVMDVELGSEFGTQRTFVELRGLDSEMSRDRRVRAELG